MISTKIDDLTPDEAEEILRGVYETDRGATRSGLIVSGQVVTAIYVPGEHAIAITSSTLNTEASIREYVPEAYRDRVKYYAEGTPYKL